VSENKLTLVCSTLIGIVNQLQLMLYSFSPNLIVISYFCVSLQLFLGSIEATPVSSVFSKWDAEDSDADDYIGTQYRRKNRGRIWRDS